MNTGIALPFHDLGAWMGMGGQHHAPAVLPPGKLRYPLYRRLGGPQGRSGMVREKKRPEPSVNETRDVIKLTRMTSLIIIRHVNTVIFVSDIVICRNTERIFSR